MQRMYGLYFMIIKFHTRSKLGANAIEVVGSKVRYGNSGDIKLGFDGDKVKLYNTIEEFKEARRNV